jgi:integrase
MAFLMPKMSRKKSGAYTARKVIPGDVRGEYQAIYHKSSEELFHAAADVKPTRARVMFNEWLADIDTRIATMRAKQRGEAHDLTQRQAQALAGEWYTWFTSPHKDNPGEAHRWRELAELLTDDIIDATPEWDNNDPRNASRDRAAEPEVRERVHPKLTDEAKTAQFLASKGEALTPAAMATFLDYLLHEFLAACDLLQRYAAGDYTADTRPQSFPEYVRRKRQALSGQTGMQLFQGYISACDLAAGTVGRWRVVFTTLDAYLAGRDVDALSDDDAQRWVTTLVTKKRSAFTVMNIWVTALKAVCSWSVKQRLIARNPFADCSVPVPKKVKLRETDAFTPEEIQAILSNANAIADTTRPAMAIRRWVPWLCAYCGARAGEITQLRGLDVFERDGIKAIRITPDAGPVKTREARNVPLHEHLIAQGFLEYVKSKGKGPLFYNVAAEAAPREITNPKRSRAVQARNRLGEWVRSIGVDDKEVSPTHGWRHSFKQIADRCGISTFRTITATFLAVLA